jgi:hypothetical protein
MVPMGMAEQNSNVQPLVLGLDESLGKSANTGACVY